MTQVFVACMMMFTDIDSFAPNFAKVLGFVSNGARSHSDVRMRQLCEFHLAGCVMSNPCLTLPNWNWDAIHLDGDGTIMVEHAMDAYDFDQCHPTMIRAQGQWGSYCPPPKSSMPLDLR
eukprot:COSAG02_NODE_4721_length_5052_cov_14.669695_5_plen_119_part_00